MHRLGQRLGRWLRWFGLALMSLWLLWTPAAIAIEPGAGLNQTIALAPAERVAGEGECAPTEAKLDLNNSNLSEFCQFPGFYPTLASLIVKNSPYETVEDVLKIPDLTQEQRDLLEANIGDFTVSPQVIPLEGRMPRRWMGR